MPSATFYQPIEKILDGRLEYEYYNTQSKSFDKDHHSRICRINLSCNGDEKDYAILMIFTIRNQSSKNNEYVWKIHSEGAKRTGPSDVVPLRNTAVRLAKENGWKYFSIAVAAEDIPEDQIICNYIVSMESYSYGDETVGVLTDDLIKLNNAGCPDFYRCETKINQSIYSFSYIKKTSLIDYLTYFDNRPYQKTGFNDVLIECENIDNELLEEQLGDILKEMYDSAADNGKQTAAILIFGIKYAGIMKNKNLKATNILKYSGIGKDDGKSYTTEFNKAKNIYECFLDNRFGIGFSKENNSNKQTFVEFRSALNTEQARNRIIFGAPGTGKSFTIEKERKELLKGYSADNYERVTFHPDYSYASFVGSYKPVSYLDEEGNDVITYSYVPGPFLRVLEKALKNNLCGEEPEPFLLIVEEINRSNVAAVFGDVFQLLDRDKDNISEYPIETSLEMRRYLSKKLNCTMEAVSKIRIPSNLFIWATMNSADQGVYPMDTAFKRRWTFKYMCLDNKEELIREKVFTLGKGQYSKKVNWNDLRKALNKALSGSCKINEDKLLGTFFISKNDLFETCKEDTAFIELFKSKVIMYLFEDAAKQKRQTLFAGCENFNSYSSVCADFDEKGIYIFGEEITKNL